MAGDDRARLEAMFDEFRPQVAAVARDALARLERRLPGAAVLVYDAYNALAIGLSVDATRRGLFLQLPVYPHWVNLGFNAGAALSDPGGLLIGAGSTVRHLRLTAGKDVDRPPIVALIDQAAGNAGYARGDGETVVKIMPWNGKKRPRR